MSEQDYTAMSDSEKKKEDWMNSKWRPAMGWLYMLVCFCDFVLFPVLYAIYIAFLYKGAMPQGVPSQWSPLTLQGAGLFHLAMGAVLGLAAYGRTQEKLQGANNGGATLPTTGSPSGAPAFGAPAAGGFGAPSSFGSPAPVTSSFGAQPLGGGSGFGSTPPVPATSGFGASPSPTSFGSAGKLGPPKAGFPEI